MITEYLLSSELWLRTICEREKNLTHFFCLVITGVCVTNFLNIANWDLIFLKQNTFIDVKTGYAKKLLLTLPPPPNP
jgi:hypothetical protein